MFGIGKKKNEEIEEVEVSSQYDSDQAVDAKEETTVENASGVDSKEELVMDEEKAEKQKESEEPPPLTYKEAKALKRSRYEENIANNSKFKNMYVIRNKRTGQVVEIRAASSFHACNIIGWKPRKVKVLRHTVIDDSKKVVAKKKDQKADPVEIKEIRREEQRNESMASSS